MAKLAHLNVLACTFPLLLSGCVTVTNPAPNPGPPEPPAPIAQDYADPVPVYEPPPPQTAVVYEDDLSPYGHWLIHERYGRCWAPNFVPYGWRPYTMGHWAYTDDGACMWIPEGRERDWGGIVYHYGQWALTAEWGWIWVPGTTWAPAWVAWREGGGYCGWAPLPPEACRGDVSYRDADRYVPADHYVYVDERNVNVTRVNEQFVTNNTTIINKTTNITNITVINNRVVNQGVPSQHVESVTGRPVQRVAVSEATTPEEARRFANSGTPVRYSAPAIERVRLITPALEPVRQKREPMRTNESVDEAQKSVEHTQNQPPTDTREQLKRESPAQHPGSPVEPRELGQKASGHRLPEQHLPSQVEQADESGAPELPANSAKHAKEHPSPIRPPSKQPPKAPPE